MTGDEADLLALVESYDQPAVTEPLSRAARITIATALLKDALSSPDLESN